MNIDFLLLEIDTKINEFENQIIIDITDIMQSEGYVKFYFDIYSYVFEDAIGNKHLLPPHLNQPLEHFNAIIDRDKLEINL